MILKSVHIIHIDRKYQSISEFNLLNKSCLKAYCHIYGIMWSCNKLKYELQAKKYKSWFLSCKMHTNHKRNQFHLFENTFCISFVLFSKIKFTSVVVCWLLANSHKLNCQIINEKPLIHRFWRTIIFESSSTWFQSWGNFYCSNNLYISFKETQLQNHSWSWFYNTTSKMKDLTS